MSDPSSRARKAHRRQDASPLANHGLHSVSPARFMGRLRYQLLVGILVAVLLPPALYHWAEFEQIWREPVTIKTTLGALLAMIIAIYLFRRVVTFPGVGMAGHVLPAITAGYSLVLVGFLGLRIEYSRLIFAISFLAAALFFFTVSAYIRNRRGQRFYVVPSPSTQDVPDIPHVDWLMLREPRIPPGDAVLIADLRAELNPDWERLIADAAVAGHPVYHIKQVMESLTGRVEIEHLSENSFGSLVPNLAYRKTKRVIDLVSALLLLPILLLPGLIVALIIKLETPGPVFFVQPRRGYRGKTFRITKFRTMRHEAPGDEAVNDAAITLDGDARITRFGRFLRRSRIDELPQIWNIIRGEMSWIGPRPEAIPLSDWYTSELSFYSYRHIVRPGITGWAQVQQGHVANLPEVQEKLHYDFYYIKNFSAWLDLLILGRTISIVLSGFGAK